MSLIREPGPGGRPGGLSIIRLVRAELRKPTAPGSSSTNADVLASRIVELSRAGDRTMLARLRRRTGVDPIGTDLTDGELVAIVVARMGLAEHHLTLTSERSNERR
jgi:hypothetical protein